MVYLESFQLSHKKKINRKIKNTGHHNHKRTESTAEIVKSSYNYVV